MNKLLKQFSLLLAAVIIVSTTFGQVEKERVANYINQYKELAIKEMMRTGVPASIKLAQGILETGGGQSDLASNAFNHFGIKCKTEWTGDRMFHDDDAKGECFRKYATVEDSYYDHSQFLATRPPYAFLFKLDPTDYEGWAKGLKKAGYATNPAYPQMLIKIIVENHLQQYSLVALERRKTLETELFAVNNPEPVRNEMVIVPEVQVALLAEQPIIIEAAIVAITSLPVNQIAYPANKVFIINESKVIYAEAGMSLLAIANNYSVAYNKLLEFNEMPETEILEKDRLIFLQRKAKKGSNEIHVVVEGETLYEIAQKEGIQLSALIEFNKIMRGMEPVAGSKLYLKSPAPILPKLVNSGNSTAPASMK